MILALILCYFGFGILTFGALGQTPFQQEPWWKVIPLWPIYAYFFLRS